LTLFLLISKNYGLLTDVYKCSSCNLVIDRDINGARNIFIKCIDEML